MQSAVVKTAALSAMLAAAVFGSGVANDGAHEEGVEERQRLWRRRRRKACSQPMAAIQLACNDRRYRLAKPG